MDPLTFPKPWIVTLLSTFDPRLPMSQTRQDALVAQVMNIQQTTGRIGDIEISGKGQLHDNHNHVNAVFTRDAVEKFEKDEEEEGCSGAEFDDIKNSIIALKKYRVIIPRDDKSQGFQHLIVCVEYFTLIHFDALPRVHKEPLQFACNDRSVVANMNRLRQMDEDEMTQPSSCSNDVTTDSHSTPHLTQLLEEINKASEDENQPKRKSYIFEISIPRPISTSDSSSSTGSEEDIRTLTKALDTMERKMTIVNGLKNLFGDKVSIDSDDSQALYNMPEFRVSELPRDYMDSIQAQMTNFDTSDFSIPLEILKKLEKIEEWVPGYVKPSSLPPASVSLESPGALGGGLSISPLPSPDKCVPGGSESPVSTTSKNKPRMDGKAKVWNIAETEMEAHRSGCSSSQQLTTGKDSVGDCRVPSVITIQESQKSSHSEAMSLGSDDWSMHSVESIGLSTEEMLQADCEVHVPPCPQQPVSTSAIRTKKPLQVIEDPKSNSTNTKPSTTSSPFNVPAKRKRNLPSEESCPKFPRQDGQNEATEKHRFKPPLEFESDGNLSPICSPNKVSTVEEVEIFHSTPLTVETQVENHDKIALECNVDSDRNVLNPDKQSQSQRKLDKEDTHLQRMILSGKKQVTSKIASGSGLNCRRTALTHDRSLQKRHKQYAWKDDTLYEPESRSEVNCNSDLSKSNEHYEPESRSGVNCNSDLSKSKEPDSPVFVEVEVGEPNSSGLNSPSRSDDGDDDQESHSQSVKITEEPSQESHRLDDSNNISEKKMKAVHFEDTCEESVKLQKTSDKTDDMDDSVEILDISTGFEPAEFYASPSSQQRRVAKQKVVMSDLKSPQLVASISTPINSLPSHQPPRTRLSLASAASQSSVESSNQSFQIANYQREVDPCVEELSNITLEDKVLHWCTSYFVSLEHKRKDNSKPAKKKRRDR